MLEKETKGDPPKLIYDLPECFMMTWEELMGMTSIVGYDIWSEDVTETTNYPTSTNGGRHFNKQPNTYKWGHFKPQSNNPYLQKGGDTLNPNQMAQHPHMEGDTSNLKISI